MAAVLHSEPLGLLLLSLSLAALFALARLPAGRIAREFRAFALLLAAMFVARSAAASGAPPFSPQALDAGALLVWRLALLLVLGTLFAATSRVSRLQAAVAWYLRPFPFLPAGRIATMVGLTITLIPLVFDSYREIADAQAARCVHGIRNPVRRLRELVLPLMLKTFGRADSIAAAMESRCYADRRSFAALGSRPADWIATLVVLLIAAAAIAAGRLL